MLYYGLGFTEDELRDLAYSPLTIYETIIKALPVNLDKRIVNNTVFFYYDAISKVHNLPADLVKEIRLDYMRNHQGALYGDMSEFISIPSFEGGKRIEIRISDVTTPRTIKRNGSTGRRPISGI